MLIFIRIRFIYDSVIALVGGWGGILSDKRNSVLFWLHYRCCSV